MSLSSLRALKPSRNFVLTVASAGTIATIGDVGCQLFIEKQKAYDPVRTARFAGVTMAFIAPCQYIWYRGLARYMMGNSLQSGFKRMLADQLVAAPLVTYAFMYGVNLMGSHSREIALQRTNDAYIPVMKNNYMIWPIMQLLNQTIVPLPFRVLFAQVVGAFWNGYLSYMTNHPRRVEPII